MNIDLLRSLRVFTPKQCVRLSGSLIAVASLFLFCHAASAATCIFVSAGTSDWNTAANWSGCGGVLPTISDDVVIPASTSTAISDAAYADNLIIGAGSTVTFNGNELQLSGNWIDSGSVVTGPIVTLVGSAAQNIGAEPNFMILKVNKGGGTATFGGDVSTEFLILDVFNSGVVDLNSKTLTITANGTGAMRPFRVYSGTFLADNGTVIYNANPVFQTDIEPLVYYNLQLLSPNQFFITASTTAMGQFTYATGVVLNLSSNTLHVGGNWNNAGGSVVGAASIEMLGSADATINSTSDLKGLIINKSSGSTVTLIGNVTSTGDLNIQGGTLALGAQTLSVGGSWSDSGTFSGGTGTVVFNGTGTQNISSEAHFNNLFVNSSGTVMLQGETTTTGNLAIIHGTVNMNGQTTHVAGNWTDTGMLSGSGTVELNGSGTQNLDTESNFDTLIIKKPTGSATLVNGITANRVNIAVGTLDLNAHSLVLQGTGTPFTIVGTFLPNAGIVDYTNANPVITATNYYDLWFGGAGTATFSAASTTVTNNMRIASGTLNLGTNTLHVGGNWTDNSTLAGGTGTVDFNGSGAQTLNAEPNFFNLTVNKPAGTLTLAGNVGAGGNATTTAGTLNAAGNSLSITGSLLIASGTTVTSTSGTITSGATTTIDGSLGTQTGNFNFNGLKSDNGSILNLAGGTATTTFWTLSGAFNGGTGTINVMRDLNITGTGTFNAGNSSMVFDGATNQQNLTTTATTTFWNLTKLGSQILWANYATPNPIIVSNDLISGGSGSGLNINNLTVNGNATNTNMLWLEDNVNTFNGTFYNAGHLYLENSGSMTANGNFVENGSVGMYNIPGTLKFNATTTYQSGLLDITTGAATTGTVMYTGGSTQQVMPWNYYYLTIDKSGGAATLSGNATTTHNFNIYNGTFGLGSHTLNVMKNWNDGGTLSGGTGTVAFNSPGGQTVGTEPNFYGLVIQSGGTVTLNGNVTSTGSLSVATGTLAIGNYSLYATGDYSNASLVTKGAGGTIFHAADYVRFTDSGGTPVTTFNSGSSVYVEVKDVDRNLDATTAETISVPVTVNAAGGSDSETMTLTETGLATGIFRSAAMSLTSGSVAVGDGILEVSANGVGTVTYTDAQDTSDTAASTASLLYTAPMLTPSVSSGGGGAGSVVILPTATTGKTQDLALTLDHVVKLNNGTAQIFIDLNANPNTTRGYALSTDSNLQGVSQYNYQSTVSITVPTASGSVTIFGRYYSISGIPSGILSLTVDLSAPAIISAVSSTTIPVVVTTNLPTVNPADLQSLVAAVAVYGKTCVTTSAANTLKQVYADAKEFRLTLTADQASAIRNFILCGISDATYKLGQSERRAVMRDYMETVHRPNVVWTDVERLATGQIPFMRNAALEHASVNKILPIFRKIFGHDPNFKIAKENLAWNTLMYRIRFMRDMTKETKGVKAFSALYKRNPQSPLDWSVVRFLGYIR